MIQILSVMQINFDVLIIKFIYHGDNRICISDIPDDTKLTVLKLFRGSIVTPPSSERWIFILMGASHGR